jgi:thiamine pyrophosphate-dependent acetolactate synthase large subunit-like protein
VIALADALAAVRNAREEDDVVVTTMSSAKVWMDQAPPHPLDLVFVPSCMGHATSYGLGIALAQPQRRVIVCNGDGSMLMSLGSLVSIAAAAPPNLTVIIMDNGVYEVTGGQPIPHRPDFVALARGSGIAHAYRFGDPAEWSREASRVLSGSGTTVIVLDIEPDPSRAAPKSPGPASVRATALRQALA